MGEDELSASGTRQQSSDQQLAPPQARTEMGLEQQRKAGQEPDPAQAHRPGGQP